MKQRVAVRAIIKKDDKTLVLRRSSGRESILKKYELPGGSVDYDEQPEDAITRHVVNDTGLHVQSTKLLTVTTYIDQDDRDIQYGIILFLIDVSSVADKMTLGQHYDHYQWKRQSNTQQQELTDSSNRLLTIYANDFTEVDSAHNNNNDVLKTSKHDDPTHVTIYSDGGSRGNPGPSAAGFVVLNGQGDVIFEGGQYLGITTNNQAEYQGVRLGLEQASIMHVKTIDFRIDSLLVVNQMNGMYKIKNRELWPIHERIRELVLGFEKVTFTHVRRELNQLADGMVNKILNAEVSNKV